VLVGSLTEPIAFLATKIGQTDADIESRHLRTHSLTADKEAGRATFEPLLLVASRLNCGSLALLDIVRSGARGAASARQDCDASSLPTNRNCSFVGRGASPLARFLYLLIWVSGAAR
jgi:hypothetical protein